jgi:hypothetical protein
LIRHWMKQKLAIPSLSTRIKGIAVSP